MKVFVAGATGGTGRCIVAELVKRNIPVRSLVRDLAAAKQILPPEVELVVGDVLKKKTLQDAIADCTVVISATGAKPSLDPFGPYMVDYEGTKNLVNAAKAKGIEQFVMVSSLCTSLILHPLNLFWLVLFWKKQAEEFLQVSTLPYTIVRPGGLKYEDNDDVVVMKPADTLFEGSIPRAKVAKVCVDALFQSTARNKIVEVIAKSGITEPASEAPTEQSIAQLFANLA
jgi:uncharacterized protein YbjT (DUF2867 family)